MRTVSGLTFLTAMVFTSLSQASLVATQAKSAWNPSVKTHVIVASKGLTFASVGYTQAAILREMYPDNQILFITNLPGTESSYRTTKQKDLQRLKFSIVEENDEKLTTTKLLSVIKKYTSNIRSVDIIGHNGVEAGPWLEDTNNRMDFKNDALMSQLKPLFHQRAYARLQGCNSGWNVAPRLSKSWGIPVLGSFTSTSFYFLAANGAYELVHGETPKERIASLDTWSFASESGAATPEPCPEGMCLTLTPESAPYHFHVHKSPKAAWLPYRKVICDASISDENCERTYAEAILTSTTAVPRKQALKDKAVFRKILEKSVCAAYGSKAGQDQCLVNLRQSHKANKFDYLPYRYGTLLKCSGLRACKFVQDSIDLRRNAADNSQDSIRLYFEHALRGHDLLKGSL